MLNTLRTLAGKAPESIRSKVDQTVSAFKGMFAKVTDTVQKVSAQPSRLPYAPRVEATMPAHDTTAPSVAEVKKAQRKAFKERCASIFNNLSTTLHKEIELAEIETNKARYDKILKFQDSITPLLTKGEQWAGLVHTYQDSLKKTLATELKLTERMNREDMQNALLMAGYVRVHNGRGYGALYNTLDAKEQQYMKEAGGTWILRDIWETAQETNSTEAILNASWDQIESGRTPILHMNRLMQVLGYEKVREPQVQYSFAREPRLQPRKQTFAFETARSHRL